MSQISSFSPLKIETARFPFWKYLDDKNFILADQMKPEFRYLAADKTELRINGNE